MLRFIRSSDAWRKNVSSCRYCPPTSGGVRTVGEVCESALLQSRDMIAEMPHAGKGVGVVKNIKNPMHLSDTPLDTYTAPPRLGEHTREILTGLLGYSAGEVEELARSETI